MVWGKKDFVLKKSKTVEGKNASYARDPEVQVGRAVRQALQNLDQCFSSISLLTVLCLDRSEQLRAIP